MFEAKHDDELLFRAVMEHLPDAVWIRDADGRLIAANAAVATMLGTPRSALGGTRASDLTIKEGPIDEWAQEDARVLTTGQTLRVEHEVDLPIGRRSMLIVKAAWRDDAGRRGIVGIARDITERKRTEEAARQAADSLLSLQAQTLRAIVDAQEQERERVARSLHDNISSTMSSLLVDLDACARAPLEEIHERIRAIRERGEGIMRALRHVSRGLHPPELEAMGLQVAIEQLTAEWVRIHGTVVDLDLTGLASIEIGPSCGKTLYRVLQEALANVAKHARATRVSVVVVRLHDELRLAVEDDGIGLHPDAAPQGLGQGLRNMRERVRLFDGVSILEATPGGGATLHIQIPTARCRD